MKPTDRKKSCPDCGVEFVGHYNSQRCKPCRIKHKKAHLKAYDEGRKEQRKEYWQKHSAEWWKKNSETVSAKRKSPEGKQKRKEWYNATKLTRNKKARDYREKNKVKLNKRQLERYYLNREKYLKQVKAYREENIEQIREKQKKYREANREYLKDRNKKYYQNNKEHFRARKRRWRSKNPDKAAVIDSRKKARILEAMLPTTDEKLIEKIHRERRKLSKKDNKEYHVDHIIPLSIGGAHHQDNMRIIDAKENMAKSNKYIPELGGVWADNALARETKKELGIK